MSSLRNIILVSRTLNHPSYFKPIINRLDFQINKRIADEVAIIASKRLRNKIAGFTTHLMKRYFILLSFPNSPFKIEFNVVQSEESPSNYKKKKEKEKTTMYQKYLLWLLKPLKLMQTSWRC